MEYSLARPPLSLPSPTSPTINPRKRSTKPHVPAACVNCQKAHLACDLSRPCKRCARSGRGDSCFNAQHKKRGRPKRNAQTTSTRAIGTDLSPATHRNILHIFPPGSSRSTFLMTQPPGSNASMNNPGNDQRTITFFLSMDICCARVSDESLNILGIYPHEFAHRSLYDFIIPEHATRLAQIHRRLLDNANNVANSSLERRTLPPTQRTTSECFYSTSSATLLSIANGSQTFHESISFKSADGAELATDTQFYLGGGLGSDLFVPGTLCQLYIICLVTRESCFSVDPESSSAVDSGKLLRITDSFMRPPESLPQNLSSTDHISSSPSLQILSSPTDISSSLSRSLVGTVGTMSAAMPASVPRPVQPSQQHAPLLHSRIPLLLASSSVDKQLLTPRMKTPSSISHPVLDLVNSAIHLPRVKQQLCDSLATTLDQQHDQQAHDRRLVCNSWAHPHEAYFREIGSSRLDSVNSSSSEIFPYQSPSFAMMDAIRHSIRSQYFSSSLNPVATHHRIPSIHSRVPSLRPSIYNRGMR
ncbi:hypothetical protein BX666DRAFT_2008234 [Dichotomocladium elegans]|nr:hypothetical protein BX666DRAFT_2008234 [Dichotomocladium elegans]